LCTKSILSQSNINPKAGLYCSQYLFKTNIPFYILIFV
jgi:hypothetical protein